MADWTVSSETGALTDVLVCPPDHYRWIPTNAIARRTLAAACLDVLDPGFVAWLKGHGIRCLDLPYRNAMALGCNNLALGGGRVISARGSAALNAVLRAEGLAVLDPDLSLFAAAAGGPDCQTCPLRREE